MVYIHFPSNLTEEEQALQAKYQKLKKKKKALQALKTPKQDTEKPVISKRPGDARDAREVARKLLKSGAIQAIQKPLTKQDQTSFKRPKGQERKRVLSDNNVAPYQPFSATQNDTFQTTNDSVTADRETSRVHNLYQQFATQRDRGERRLTDKKSPSSESNTSITNRSEKQRIGNTIYVSGIKITEEYMKTNFSQFGKIVNVSMEIEKGRGFVTFTKPENADRAINDMDGKIIAGIILRVQLARRQPQIEPINDASSSAVWSTLAANHSQKANHHDFRHVVEYDDEDMFK